MSYENWTIEKSIINYSGDDEELQKKSDEAHKEYSTVAEWCNQGGEYHIEDAGEYYHTVKNPEPTQEELIQQEIAELKSQLDATDWIVVKISETAETGTDEEVAELKEKYSDELEKRKEYRLKINELEKELAEL
jgi:DNA-binding ferritin-like protein